jgi:hypothetical protein
MPAPILDPDEVDAVLDEDDWRAEEGDPGELDTKPIWLDRRQIEQLRCAAQRPPATAKLHHPWRNR